MDRDKVAVADELVELDIMHMAACAGLRRVQHQEQMIVVAMDLGHLIPIRRIPNRKWMEPERRAQRPLGLLIPHRDVYPDQPVCPGQQADFSAASNTSSPAAERKRTSMPASRMPAGTLSVLAPWARPVSRVAPFFRPRVPLDRTDTGVRDRHFV